MTRLTRIDVCRFRGIFDSSVMLNGGSLVLGGGNGTGKSALVDAIEFLFTGAVGTLSGTAGISLRQHGAHLLAQPGETVVEAHTQEPGGTLSRRLSGGIEVSAGLQRFAARGEKVTFILRRSQLQEFIHAKPAERYRMLADLLGADSLEPVETALRKARDSSDRTVTELQSGQADLSRLLEALPRDSPDEVLLDEANRAIRELGVDNMTIESFDAVERVRAEAVRRIRRERQDPLEETRGRLLGYLTRGVGQDRLRDALVSYVELLPGRQAAHGQSSLLELLQLLRRGREHIQVTDARHCPLCEQEIETRALLSRLMRRVAQLEEVSVQQQRLDRAARAVETAVQDTAQRLREIERVQADAQVTGRASASLGAAVSMLQASLESGSTVECVEMAQRVLDALDAWLLWARETEEKFSAPEAPGVDTRDPLETVLAILQHVTAQHAQGLRGAQERARLEEECSRIAADLLRAQRALRLADAAYTAFLRARNAEIQRIFDALRHDLVAFYDYLHPGEGHSALSIAMDPRKRGSSDLRMGFYAREDEDPRAFASEGHLDSLGLCIFLAFARGFNGDWPLLVLDDVVSSVDAAHKRRVADLLFREFGDRQLIITTHDSRWFTGLRRAQEETSHLQDTSNVIIESWTLEAGPVLRPLP